MICTSEVPPGFVITDSAWEFMRNGVPVPYEDVAHLFTKELHMSEATAGAPHLHMVSPLPEDARRFAQYLVVRDAIVNRIRLAYQYVETATDPYLGGLVKMFKSATSWVWNKLGFARAGLAVVGWLPVAAYAGCTETGQGVIASAWYGALRAAHWAVKTAYRPIGWLLRHLWVPGQSADEQIRRGARWAELKVEYAEGAVATFAEWATKPTNRATRAIRFVAGVTIWNRALGYFLPGWVALPLTLLAVVISFPAPARDRVVGWFRRESEAAKPKVNSAVSRGAGKVSDIADKVATKADASVPPVATATAEAVVDEMSQPGPTASSNGKPRRSMTKAERQAERRAARLLAAATPPPATPPVLP